MNNTSSASRKIKGLITTSYHFLAIAETNKHHKIILASALEGLSQAFSALSELAGDDFRHEVYNEILESSRGTDLSIQAGDAIDAMLGRVRSFLAELEHRNKKRVSTQSAIRHNRRRFLVLLMIAAFYIGLFALAPDPSYKTRLKDLKKIETALFAYKRDNGHYPVAEFVKAYSDGGLNVEWIPGLVPKYMKAIPRDPRGEKEPSKQYLYVSNGKDFKLIAHGVDDCAELRYYDASRIDPRRPDWAYGYWTPDAAQW